MIQEATRKMLLSGGSRTSLGLVRDKDDIGKTAARG